jgi:hypothetical protein
LRARKREAGDPHAQGDERLAGVAVLVRPRGAARASQNSTDEHGHPAGRPDLQGMTTTTTTTRSTTPSATKRPASLPVRSKLRAGGLLGNI